MGKVLGEGAFARVFAARMKSDGKDYAIKVMEKKFIMKEGKAKEVQMERRVLSDVDHPNVVRLYFSFHDKDHLYMVLDLCPGGELARVIRHYRKDNRSLPEADARFYLAEITHAVQYLHSINIIHRDVKPENVLLTAEGHVKLTDFGTAKDSSVAPALGDDGRPRKDTFCGSAEYVSPEVLQDGVAGVGADLWALGCVLFVMLVGRTPFVADSEYLIFQKILGYAGAEREPDDPEPDFTVIDFPAGATELSASVLDLTRKLLAPKPGDRLGVTSAKDVWAHAWLSGASDAAKLEPPRALPFSTTVDAPALDGAKNDWMLLDEGEDDLLDEFANRKSTPASPNARLSTASSSGSGPGKPVELGDVLNAGERVVHQGQVTVSAHGGLVTRRRVLVLTDLGRLLVVDPPSTIKAQVPLRGSTVSVKPSGKEFVIALPRGSRAFRFKDSSGGAMQWKELVDKFC